VTAGPNGLELVALVVHARDVASETREAFARQAANVVHDQRAVLLHTCHRADLYVVDERSPDGDRLVLPRLPRGGRRLDGPDAARHLFTFAAGLDSVIVGEEQGLHQLRQCLAWRHAAPAEGVRGTNGGPVHAAPPHPVLERLFQTALRLGRETRSRREGPPRSLADVALDRITSSTGPLLGRRVLIVGAGRMARLAALAAARQGAHILVANRSHDRAAALAHDAGGHPAPFGPSAPLPPSDAVVVAIGGQWQLSDDAREALLVASIPVVDLSSPPALEEGMRSVLRDRYVSVDDLARHPQDPLRERSRRRFERALLEAERSFEQWLHARSAVPAIQALSDHAEQHRVEELQRLFRRMDLPPHEQELVEQMSRRLVAGLLHRPLESLREDADGDLTRAARTLFSL